MTISKGEKMTVKDLIKKLQEYPMEAELGCRDVSVVHEGVDRHKLILIVDGHELDPVFQFTGPFQHGFGERKSIA